MSSLYHLRVSDDLNGVAAAVASDDQGHVLGLGLNEAEDDDDHDLFQHFRDEWTEIEIGVEAV